MTEPGSQIPPEVVTSVIGELFKYVEPEGQVHFKLAVAKMENAHLQAALDELRGGRLPPMTDDELRAAVLAANGQER